MQLKAMHTGFHANLTDLTSYAERINYEYERKSHFMKYLVLLA